MEATRRCMTQNDSTTILQNENKSLFHKNHIITKNGYKLIAVLSTPFIFITSYNLKLNKYFPPFNDLQIIMLLYKYIEFCFRLSAVVRLKWKFAMQKFLPKEILWLFPFLRIILMAMFYAPADSFFVTPNVHFSG